MTTDAATRSISADLRAWAKGIYPTEAAVELLLQAFNGRFARPGWPWIKTTGSGAHYLDAANLSDDDIGALSGGERRVLTITRSLLGQQPVDLADTLTGLDRPTGRAVIDALTHATGAPKTIRSGTHSRYAGRSITPNRDVGWARELG